MDHTPANGRATAERGSALAHPIMWIRSRRRPDARTDEAPAETSKRPPEAPDPYYRDVDGRIHVLI
jgi:hypothetical protein